MSDPHDATHRRAPLPVGTNVEVRTGLDDAWSVGFVVEEITNTGYRLRRRSDNGVLPTEFDLPAVRRERKRSMWWY